MLTKKQSGSRCEPKQWGILLPAMLLPFGGAVFYFILLAGSDWAPKLYGAVKLFTLLYPLIIVIGIERRSLNPAHWRQHLYSLPMGLLTGLLMALVIAAAFAWTPWGDLLLANAARIHRKAADLGVLNHYVVFAVAISFLHSLLEEYYWRWFVFGRVRQLVAAPLAHLLAGLAFALHHYIVLSQFVPWRTTLIFGTFVGFGGIVWSWQYARYRSIAGAWLSHVCVDLVIFALGYIIIF